MVCRPVHLEQAFFLDNCQFVGSGVSPLWRVDDRAVIIGHDGLPGRPTTAGQDRVKVDMSKAAPGPLVIDSGGQHSSARGPTTKARRTPNRSHACGSTRG